VARRSSLLAGVAVVAALAAGGWAVAERPGRAPAVAADVTPSLTTTSVKRADLADERLFSGTLGFGADRKVQGTGAGVVTRLPAVGTPVTRGTRLYRVDDQPVVVFYGDTPPFRAIDRPGLVGSDVLQLRRNLAALGFPTWSVHADAADQSLLAALRSWQAKLGVAAPGTLKPGQVVVVGGPGRVSALDADPGSPAAGPILRLSSTSRVVTVPMSAVDAGTVTRGARVTITLPDARETPGTVTAISRTITQTPDSDEPPKVTVTINPGTAKDVASLDAAPVQVRFTTAARRNVLTVPVGALVALREGGYAVQRPDGSLIAAATGVFAGGLVEVSGPGIAEGLTVVTAP
jgi:peptidoglycan hydrolase-like protein with peptidoglycan-binding domain